MSNFIPYQQQAVNLVPAIAFGRAPSSVLSPANEMRTEPIRVDAGGCVVLSDEDVERIAERVVERLRADLVPTRDG